jgi:hypothetical protein
MASIEEVRAAILAANEKAKEALGAVNQAHTDMESAQANLAHATEGSGQVDVTAALGLAAQAVNNLAEERTRISALLSESEGITNRL